MQHAGAWVLWRHAGATSALVANSAHNAMRQHTHLHADVARVCRNLQREWSGRPHCHSPALIAWDGRSQPQHCNQSLQTSGLPSTCPACPLPGIAAPSYSTSKGTDTNNTGAARHTSAQPHCNPPCPARATPPRDREIRQLQSCTVVPAYPWRERKSKPWAPPISTAPAQISWRRTTHTPCCAPTHVLSRPAACC